MALAHSHALCQRALLRRVCAPSGHRLPKRLAPAQVVISSRHGRGEDSEIEKVLFTTEQLNEMLDDMGRKIGHDYADKHLLVLGVLKGGAVFTADLIRHVNPVPLTMEVEFFRAASYGLGTHTTGSVKLDTSFDISVVKDKHVLVTEDIVDTGLTMASVVAYVRAAGAMSVRVAALLDKRDRRQVAYEPDYCGAHIPDAFVVGYGIDFAERYRWLPYIGIPKPEVVKRIQAEQQVKQQARLAAEQAALQAAEHVGAAQGVHANGTVSNGTEMGNKGIAVVSVTDLNKLVSSNGSSNGTGNKRATMAA